MSYCKILFSIAASPFLSPYVIMHSRIGAFLALVASPYEIAAAVIGMEAIVLIRFLA